MSEVEKTFSIQSYIDKNRKSLDESLVSLRIMKEIDKFLDSKNLSNKDFAIRLGYSESYISQLMSGVKNINVSFISKFETEFSTKFDFKIYLENEEAFVHKLNKRINFNLNINVNMLILNEEHSNFSFIQDSKSVYNVTETELTYETL